MRNEYDLLEDLLEAAEPCFNENDRGNAYGLNGGDTIFPIMDIVAAVIRENHPVPENLLSQLQEWIDHRAGGYYRRVRGAASDRLCTHQTRARGPRRRLRQRGALSGSSSRNLASRTPLTTSKPTASATG